MESVAEWLRSFITDHKSKIIDMSLCPDAHLKFKVSRHIHQTRITPSKWPWNMESK
jgi:hypothetical protein